MNFNDQDADGKTMLHHAIEMKKFSKANIIVKLGRIIGKYHLILSTIDCFGSRNLQLCFSFRNISICK